MKTLSTKKYKIVLFLLAIVAFISFNAPLASLFFNDSSQITSIRNDFKKQKRERTKIINDTYQLIDNYEKGNLTSNEFIKESRKLSKLHEEKQLQVINTFEKLNSTKKEISYFRFTSFKVFISQFGIVFSLFLSSLIIFTISVVFVRPTQVKSLFYIVSCLVAIPAIFYILWIFTPDIDLSQTSYIFTFIVISIGVSILLFLSYKVILELFLKRISLKSKIATLLNLVSSLRYNYYFPLAKKAVNKKLSKEEVIDDAQKLDESIYKTFEKIL
ncbi:hypothetical protein [Aquimarina sp. TRL1]|uniref:hypothetical protein n=1 Tax=Aquimarina sp. (strain TRL1) TaxID=2736252 RepID=UPI001C37E1B5|nr:hypothetical protein [Aquimarina sp. TRL1]